MIGNTQTPADESDVQLEVRLDDVRRKSDLADYTGEVDAGTTLQITDKYNGSSPVDPGTLAPFVPVAVPCTATANTGIGSSCSALTSAEAVVPGAVKESARTVWQLAQVEVNDGGADDQAATVPEHHIRAPGHLRSLAAAGSYERRLQLRHVAQDRLVTGRVKPHHLPVQSRVLAVAAGVGTRQRHLGVELLEATW